MIKQISSIITDALILLFIFSAGFISCDSSSESSDNPIPYLTSDLSRNLSPDATSDEKGQLIAGNTDFAFDLFMNLADPDKNIIYSPYSLSLAMAMAYGGAENNTASEIAGAFYFTLPEDRFHQAFNAADLVLRSREYSDPETAMKLKLVIANSFWGQTDYNFLASYLDLLALNYGAGIYLLDFRTQPDACTDIINNWIEEKTEGLIKEAIGRGVITTDTRAVLTNAVYFYANWLKEFAVEATTPEPFYLNDGSQTTADTMHQEEIFNYHEDGDSCSVELPYAGNKMSMFIVMPKGDFQTFEAAFSRASLDAIVSNLEPANINLSMPKFKIEYSIDILEDILESMGMVDAFNGSAADFSGITGDRSLFISDIIHKAVIAVDETGTEAAAVTVIIVGATCIPVTPAVEVNINRPFYFFIRDMETGVILFMGRVLNPNENS